MVHSRSRFILKSLKKRLDYFPVVSIQGARQVGKSYLVRELLKKEIPRSAYFTLDDQGLRDRIKDSPRLFLESHNEHHPLAIDEAQKAPELFDAFTLHGARYSPWETGISAD